MINEYDLLLQFKHHKYRPTNQKTAMMTTISTSFIEKYDIGLATEHLSQ